MSLETAYAMTIRPYIARDYLTIRFFSPAIRYATLFIGPPGVGKSTSVRQAAESIAAGLSVAFKKAFEAVLTRQDVRENAGKWLRGFFAMVFSSYPVVTYKEGRPEFQDFIYAKSTPDWKVSGFVLSEFWNMKPDEIFKAWQYADYTTAKRAEEAYGLFEDLWKVLTAVAKDGSSIAAILKTPLPMAVVNEDIELVDFPAFVVVDDIHKYVSTSDLGRCVKWCRPGKGGGCGVEREDGKVCTQYVTRRGVLLVSQYDDLVDKLYSYARYSTRMLPEQILPKQGVKFAGVFLHYIDLRLSQMELDDVKGLPSDILARVLAVKYGVETAKKAKTMWLAPAWAQKGGFGILFFDEINQAPKYTQAAAYNLILDRRTTTGYRYPDNVLIVAAGNQPEFAPEVAQPLPAPLRNRFAGVFNMDMCVGAGNLISIEKGLLEYLDNKYVGGMLVKSFTDYLKSVGAPETTVELEATVDKIGKSLCTPLTSKEWVVVTPRSVEFAVTSIARKPEELYAIFSKYDERFRNLPYLDPVSWLVVTAFGALGLREGKWYAADVLASYGVYIVASYGIERFMKGFRQISERGAVPREVPTGTAQPLRSIGEELAKAFEVLERIGMVDVIYSQLGDFLTTKFVQDYRAYDIDTYNAAVQYVKAHINCGDIERAYNDLVGVDHKLVKETFVLTVSALCTMPEVAERQKEVSKPKTKKV